MIAVRRHTRHTFGRHVIVCQHVRVRRIRSNERMVPRTRTNVCTMLSAIDAWRSPHRAAAVRFLATVGPRGLFEILHSMRRWYSGQTMARCLLAYRAALRTVMRLEPQDARGAFRGFRVPRTHRLAAAVPGARVRLAVTRNHGISSWSTTEAPTHRFSGAGPDRVGLVVRLVETDGVAPLLAPPSHTAAWFNALYERVVGRSFRPTEGEYLLATKAVTVEIVRVKT
jgi:hypothetical protein